MRCDNHITLFHFVLVDSVRKKSNKKQKTKVIVYISINKKRKKTKTKKQQHTLHVYMDLITLKK